MRLLQVTLTVKLQASAPASWGPSTSRITGRTARLDDFEVYQQATEPTGSDTALTLVQWHYQRLQAYYDFAEVIPTRTMAGHLLGAGDNF